MNTLDMFVKDFSLRDFYRKISICEKVESTFKLYATKFYKWNLE